MTTVTSRGYTFDVGIAEEDEIDADLPVDERRVNDEASMSGCGCFNGPCSEVVPVSIYNNTYNITAAGALNVELDEDTDTPLRQRFEIWLEDDDGNVVEDRFTFVWRLVDSQFDTDKSSTVVPSQPGTSGGVVHSDEATGIAEVIFEETVRAQRQWTLVVEFAGAVEILANAVDVGVP